MKLMTPLTIAAVLLISACASGDADVDSTPGATTDVKVESGESAETGDVTSELTTNLSSDLASFVVSAKETEPGRIEVGTSIVDPRGDDGSSEAQSAIAICEAATGLDGVTYVSVLEDDGTTFVLYGHPSVPEGECGEI